MAVSWCAGIAASQSAKETAGKRPAIVGVAHIALKVSDLAAARNFYSHGLGFQEAFSTGSGEPMAVCFKVNDHQYIEVSPNLKGDEDRLSHIAYETSDARQLRAYLASRGIAVPEKLRPDSDGNLSFMVQDPDSHNVEFVQYLPGSLHSRNFGKFLADTRISERIMHVGVTVQEREPADRFYKDILDSRLMWYGGGGNRTNWVAMRMPEGTDWLEYMLNVRKPMTPKVLGIMHHLSVQVPSVEAGYRTLLERSVKLNEKPNIGMDGRWQINAYDPDLSRCELMERKPVRTPRCSPIIDE